MCVGLVNRVCHVRLSHPRISQTSPPPHCALEEEEDLAPLVEEEEDLAPLVEEEDLAPLEEVEATVVRPPSSARQR